MTGRPLKTTYATNDVLTAANMNDTNTEVNASTYTGVTTSVANELALFNGTDGKGLKRATSTGVVVVNSGVVSASVPAAASVATGESTTSGTYTDLATTTDQVTVTIGPSGMALISIAAQITNSGSAGVSTMSFAASGANTIAADDANSIFYKNPFAGGSGDRHGTSKLLTGLAAGSTTFKLKYKAGNTGTFTYRDISVIPL